MAARILEAVAAGSPGSGLCVQIIHAEISQYKSALGADPHFFTFPLRKLLEIPSLEFEE
jgi:hypothetical protein